MQKTWLADGITDENSPAARTAGAHIIGRAFAHEYEATGDLIAIADFGLGLTMPQYEIAIRAGRELLEG